MHEIERNEHGTRGVLAGQCGMQREEVREPVLAHHNGLAIDHGAAHLQPFQGSRDALHAILCELAAKYRAKAAQTRARLRAIKRADFRETVLGVARTYESWAREIEKSAGEAGEGRRIREPEAPVLAFITVSWERMLAIAAYSKA